MQHKTYYAVIFTSVKKEDDTGYDEMAEKMVNLAGRQPGFLGIESARNEIGITVSYWENAEAVKNWKKHTEHLIAQRKGKADWYRWYRVRVCQVEREYEFGDPAG